MKKFVLALALMLGFTLTAPGLASAAPVSASAGATVAANAAPIEVTLQAAKASYWAAGGIYENYYGGGIRQTIVFPDYGPCDPKGYRLNLTSGSLAGFGNFISSVDTGGYLKKNCNNITIVMKSNNNNKWTCNLTCLKSNKYINFGGGFNDNVGYIYWHQ